MSHEFSDQFIQTLGFLLQLDIPEQHLEAIRQNLILLSQYSHLIHQFHDDRLMKAPYFEHDTEQHGTEHCP